jgi:hypothetical protein
MGSKIIAAGCDVDSVDILDLDYSSLLGLWYFG